MATQQETSPLRRRSRTTTHGWFDHGDKSLFPLPAHLTSQPTNLPNPWSPSSPPPPTLERHLPTIRFLLLLITRILATIALLGPAIILSTTTLRTTQLLCQHDLLLSPNSAICNNTWLQHQQSSILSTLPADKTPITTTLSELNALNTHLSPSLGFLGLPLFHANLNLSDILTDLEETLPNKTHLEALALQNLTSAGAKAHEFAELFSSKEADCRRVSSTWDENGTRELQQGLEEMEQTLRGWGGWIREGVLNAVPWTAKYTVNYQLVSQYHDFVSTQEIAVRELVMDAVETGLLLLEFVDEIGRVETQLMRTGVSSGVLEELSTIRMSAAWALKVTRKAGEHYKTMYSSMLSWVGPLGDDVASYESWWVARNTMPLSRLREIVEIEIRQLGGTHARAERAEEVLDGLFEEFMKGGEGAAELGYKLDAAAREGRVEWV